MSALHRAVRVLALAAALTIAALLLLTATGALQ